MSRDLSHMGHWKKRDGKGWVKSKDQNMGRWCDEDEEFQITHSTINYSDRDMTSLETLGLKGRDTGWEEKGREETKWSLIELRSAPRVYVYICLFVLRISEPLMIQQDGVKVETTRRLE